MRRFGRSAFACEFRIFEIGFDVLVDGTPHPMAGREERRKIDLSCVIDQLWYKPSVCTHGDSLPDPGEELHDRRTSDGYLLTGDGQMGPSSPNAALSTPRLFAFVGPSPTFRTATAVIIRMVSL